MSVKHLNQRVLQYFVHVSRIDVYLKSNYLKHAMYEEIRGDFLCDIYSSCYEKEIDIFKSYRDMVLIIPIRQIAKLELLTVSRGTNIGIIINNENEIPEMNTKFFPDVQPDLVFLTEFDVLETDYGKLLYMVRNGMVKDIYSHEYLNERNTYDVEHFKKENIINTYEKYYKEFNGYGGEFAV